MVQWRCESKRQLLFTVTARAVQEHLMQLPMHTWTQCMEAAAGNEAELSSLALQQSLHNVLLSHVSVCQSLGGFFLPQMVKIFSTMLSVYRKYSALINASIRQAGPLGAQHSAIKSMRSIKKVTLKLVETFVETSESAEHLQVIATQFVSALMDPVLSDYAESLPDAKCACASCVRKYLQDGSVAGRCAAASCVGGGDKLRRNAAFIMPADAGLHTCMCMIDQ
jgi:CRM1 C terminal